MIEEFMWSEKYRPHTIKDTILPDDLKKSFQAFVNKKSVPNLLLIGPSGVGKTSVALALMDELGYDYIIKNGSLEGRNIDTLRIDMMQFASTMSLTGNRKYIVLDEADGITNVNQLALRNFTEQYATSCGFIFTANYRNKVIEPIHSRCAIIDFVFPKSEISTLGVKFLKRVMQILEAEGIGYDKAVLAQLLKKFYPDFRRFINELQHYSQRGEINTGIFSTIREFKLDDLLHLLKNKKFNDLRIWVAENIDIEEEVVYHDLYKHCSQFLDEKKIPSLILTINKYQFQSYFVADREINLMACLTELMIDCF